MSDYLSAAQKLVEDALVEVKLCSYLNHQQIKATCEEYGLATGSFADMIGHLLNYAMNSIVLPEHVPIVCHVDDAHRWAKLHDSTIQLFETMYDEAEHAAHRYEYERVLHIDYAIDLELAKRMTFTESREFIGQREKNDHEEIMASVHNRLGNQRVILYIWANKENFGITEEEAKKGEAVDFEGDIEMGDAEMDLAEVGHTIVEDKQVVGGPVQPPESTQSLVELPDLNLAFSIRTKQAREQHELQQQKKRRLEQAQLAFRPRAI